jgi:Phage integrase family
VLKRARISKFRWHDLRHHLASRLVQQGVPLNTVRDLLGHGSVGMSLRYAHLAPDQRRKAVAKLNERPLLTLTMRLQWEGLPVASGYRVDSILVREGRELAGQIPLSGFLGICPSWSCAYKRTRKCLDF